MDRKTKQKVFLCCLGFLTIIYGLASIDGGRRKKVQEEVAAMAEKKEVPEIAKEKIMYLTFDDGPSANTEKVLDILDKYSIKATFFVTGENPEYADMIKTIYDRGHALGIHTFSHEYSKIYVSKDAYMEDLQKVAALIKDKSGQDVHIVRFPGGSSNTVSRNYCQGVMTQLSQEMDSNGYQYYDWNAHNGDGDPSLSAESLYNRAMKDIKGKDEVMMLMHDGAGNENTVESLDDVLQSMVQQGWTFKTIEETAEMSVFHHHIAN